MRIGVDINGGDFAPQATLEGARLALQELPENIHLVLLGDAAVISDFAKKEKLPANRIEIIDAPETI
jgi:phosphate acyltransferase